MEKAKGFVAYASTPAELTTCIKDGIVKANSSGECEYRGWEEQDIVGRQLIAPIFKEMADSNVLVADITTINFNVVFEIGYAIGINKRVYLIKSKEYDNKTLSDRIGIFDTLGYKEYENSDNLADVLKSIKDFTPINTTKSINKEASVYIVFPPIESDMVIQVRSLIKKARLFYRSFSPSEEVRMSAIDAISNTSSSHGIVVPLLSKAMHDSNVHNIRAAFISGLGIGLNKQILVIRNHSESSEPLDIRDLVKSYTKHAELKKYVHDFACSIVERMQERVNVNIDSENSLSNISIGDPVAENEYKRLDNYYLQTNEFSRTLRGGINIVLGRKGTGKSALFFQARDKKRDDGSNIVLDLRPEGYQLIKLKERVLDFLYLGAKQHLITAFWEFLFYLEICHKILQADKSRHRYDHQLHDKYLKLKEMYNNNQQIEECDFSERLQIISNYISDNFEKKHKKNDYESDSYVPLSTDEITKLLHSSNIPALRDSLFSYLKHKKEVWIFFDNLDRGWSTHGISSGDINILRCLIDASRKMEREFNKKDIPFYSIVFIRNDVYQLLMDETSDFGKESKADLDWKDPDMLREMINKRLKQNNQISEEDIGHIWQTVCVSHIDGEETLQYMIDRTLMRPRNLIKIFNAIIGIAINLNHEKIEEEDIKKGMKVYSSDLLVEADQELSDIEPQAKRLLYKFHGEDMEYTHEELVLFLKVENISEEETINNIIKFLVYYGFLGVSIDNNIKYIYDVGYNMEILKAEINKHKHAIKYIFNPAFWPALEIKLKE